MSQQALLIIDLQNDYFPQGKYPQYNSVQTLTNIEITIEKAQQKNIPIIIIAHIADTKQGIAPFFNPGTQGAEIHPTILKAAPNADIVIKSDADSFERTNLQALLQKHKVSELLITGMMTQNCVTHTAISQQATQYNVTVLMDCCTSVDEMIHNIALHALSTRVNLQTIEQVFS